FLPPDEAELLACRRLDGDPCRRDAQCLADDPLHRRNMTGDLRRFTDDCHVEIDYAAAGPGHEIAGMLEEDGGGRAVPLHVGGWEVDADIALADGAENGVGQRMQGHVRIRM